MKVKQKQAGTLMQMMKQKKNKTSIGETDPVKETGKNKTESLSKTDAQDITIVPCHKLPIKQPTIW